MSDYQELSAAYVELRQRIDTIIDQLGGAPFAHAIVPRSAAEALRAVNEKHTGRSRAMWEIMHYQVFSEALLATPDEMRRTCDVLLCEFSIRDVEPTLCGPISGGQLVVRENDLYFETDRAALLLVECYADRYTAGRWNVVINRKGEAFLDLMGLPKPSVTRTSTKSQSAAMKSLSRIASDLFGVELVANKRTASA